MISKHPRLTFFRMNGCIKDFVIHCNIHCIKNFLPYYAHANSEESGKLCSYPRSTWSMVTFHILDV